MTQQARRVRTRLLAATALPVVTALALAACSSGGGTDSGSSKEPQTISLSYMIANNATSPYEVLAKKYESTHKGVTIKLTATSVDSYGQTITTQLQAGNGPDVFQVQGGTGQVQGTVNLAKAGLLAPLTGKNIAATIPSGQENLFTYKGKQYEMPVELLPTGLIYNDVAAKADGVTLTASSTLQDMYKACTTARSKGHALFALAGSISQNTGIVAVAIAISQVYGKEPNFNADRASGKTTFAADKYWKATLQTIVDMKDKGCFQDGAAGAGFDALTNGVGSLNATSYAFTAPVGAVADLENTVPGLKLEVMPFWAPKGEKTRMIVTADDGLAINAKTKSPKLTQDFLNWMAEPAQASLFAKTSGDLPIVGTNALLPQYEPVKNIIDDKSLIGPFPYSDWPNGQVYDALGTGVTGLLTGQATVDQVLQSMDQAWG